jgi:chromosome segregation ATPase
MAPQRLQNLLNATREQLEDAGREVTVLQRENANLKREVAELMSELNEIGGVGRHQPTNFLGAHGVSDQALRNEGEILDLRRKLRELTTHRDELLLKNEALMRTLQRKDAEVTEEEERLSAHIEELQNELTKVCDENLVLEKNLAIREQQDTEMMRLQSIVAGLKGDLDAANAAREDLDRRLRQQKMELQARQQDHALQIQAIQKELDDANAQVLRLQAELKSQAAEMRESMNALRESGSAALRAQEELLHAAKKEVKMAIEEVRRHARSVDELKAENESLREQTRSAATTDEQVAMGLRVEIEVLKKEVARVSAEKDAALRQLNQLTEAAEAERRERTAEIDALRHEAAASTVHEELKEALGENERLRKRVAEKERSMQAQLEDSELANEALQQTVAELREKIVKVTTEALATERQLVARVDNLRIVVSSMQRTNRELESQLHKERETGAKISALTTENLMLRSQLDASLSLSVRRKNQNSPSS